MSESLLYVPWWRRRELWRHDHNTGDERDWRPEKVVAVGKLIRVGDGRFEARCPCGTLFVADTAHHVVDPQGGALGII